MFGTSSRRASLMALERRVLRRIEARISVGVAVDARLHHGGEALLADLGAGDEGSNLLFLLHLPVDVFLDVRMIDIDDDHLRGAPRGAARLDGAGRAIADLQEAHQARRFSAARERLIFAAQTREITSRTGTIFEETRLARPEVHDAAGVHQIIADALNEAVMDDDIV